MRGVKRDELYPEAPVVLVFWCMSPRVDEVDEAVDGNALLPPPPALVAVVTLCVLLSGLRLNLPLLPPMRIPPSSLCGDCVWAMDCFSCECCVTGLDSLLTLDPPWLGCVLVILLGLYTGGLERL